MNMLLQSLFSEAESRLAEADFTAEELANLRALDASPVELACEEDVAALFARRA